MDQPGRAPGMHRSGRAGELAAEGGGVGRRLGAEHRDLLLGLLERQRQAGVQQIEDVAERGALLGHGAQAAGCVPAVLQLQGLQAQPLRHAGGPRDVGASVEIVADPAGDGDEVGVQLGPALRIDLSRDVEHEAAQSVQRGVQVD